MALIVQKYGGTSVGSVERIGAVADRVARFKSEGHDVVVVVSAMSGETNRLMALAKEIQKNPAPRELDALLSTGEKVTTALLSMALGERAVRAKSFSANQVGILTDSAHNKARIQDIRAEALQAELEVGGVPVVAGFQGVDVQGNVTTLGRGGSDTTAVALAAALKADECQIYTDVDGVYTTDPRMVDGAKRLDQITFEEMLEMASAGAKVLETRSVAMAMSHHVKLQVRSSFVEEDGTLVIEEDDDMEKQKISGIAYSPDEAKVTLVGLPDRPGIAATVFGALADSHINVDMIVQSASPDDSRTDITFSVAALDADKAVQVLEQQKSDLAFDRVIADTNIAKISVIGTAMRSQPGIARTMFSVLAEKGINLHVISTSEIKISTLIDADYTELAVRSLHDAYGLETS